MRFKIQRSIRAAYPARKALLAAAIPSAAMLFALSPAVAQETETAAPSTEGTPEQVQPGAVAESPKPENTLDVHGLFGVDFTTHYISRGLVLEDQGFIAQPYFELGFTLLEEEDAALSKLTLFGGIWNSLHGQHTDAGLTTTDPDTGEAASGITTDAWYEFDWYVGTAIDFAEKFNLNLSYWEFISPNQGFGTSKNFQAKLAYNDMEHWGDGGFALKPYGIVFIETGGKAGSGSEEGIYVELGIEPTIFTLGKDGTYPVALSVPVKVGLGFSDFYEDDEAFGYAMVGLKGSVPLAFIPANYGAWSATAGVYYYHYGDGVDDFNEGTGDGDDDIVASAGISLSF